MATDEFRGGRMGGGGVPPRAGQAAPSANWPSQPSDLSRQINRLEARLKSIADGAPLPGGDHAVDAAIDDAVTRLASDLRRSSGSAAAPTGKGRFDFRMPSARRDDLHDAAGRSNHLRQAAPFAEAPVTPETVESQFEAIRQRMSELVDERPAARTTAAFAPPAPEPDEPLPLAGADYLDVIERMEGLARSVPDKARIERLAESVARLGEVMSGSGHLATLASIESRVGQLSEEMQALTERPATDAELHARLADIRSLVIAASAADKGVARLESQFAAIAERIETALARVPRADAIVAIANRLDAVTGRLDQIGANLQKPAPALEGLAREIALIRREIAEGNNRFDPAVLDAQFAALAKRFDAMARVGGAGPSVGHLEAQIQRLTEKIDEGFARRSPAQTPQEQARGPARATTTTGPKVSDNPLVDALKDDLSRLGGAQQIAPTQPANPAAAAATLNAAMETFVRRLATMEAQARQGTQPTPPPLRQRVSESEAEDDRRPLEPGSGRPGRQSRETRKSEFVAAARRAAQAAAAEAPAGERYEPRPRPAYQQTQPGAMARFGQSLHRRQRVLMAAAAAIAVLALGSLPAINMLRPAATGAITAATGAASSNPVTPAATTTTTTTAPGIDATTTATEGPPRDGGTSPPQNGSSDSFDGQLFGAEDAAHFAPETESTPTLTIPDAADVPTLKIPDTLAPAAATNPAPAAGTKDTTRPATAPQSLKVAPPPDAVGTPALRTAAASGDPAALFEVGARYAEGRGIKPNPSEAARWYGIAAERGLAVAQFRYASLNERGEGVTQDRKAAAEWYRRAAEQGNVRAMHNLAVMLSEGVGGPPDFSGAARWFSRAADFGVKDSQYNLGVMYARGLGGVQDLVESYKWFAIAAQQGDADATGRRDEVAKTLNPDQLARAQAAVMSWRADTPPEKANTPPSPDDWGATVPSPLTSLDRTGLIKLIQERLTDRGFDPGPADGQPGPMTRDAVIAFQRKSGLPATGEMGPELLAALDLPSR